MPLDVDQILREVKDEVASAMVKHAPMASAHEGYALILEELDELWDEVKTRRTDRSKVLMYDEARQVATMAVRFMLEVCS